MDTLPVFFSFFLYAGQPCIEIDLANDTCMTLDRHGSSSS
jgi:hypothetical protein